MDALDAYDALRWAVEHLEGEQDPIAPLYLQHLRELRDEKKKEAGR